MKETDEEKIARYKAKEQDELDQVAAMANEDETVSNAYGGSLDVDEQFKDRFEDALDKKIEKKTDCKIDKALNR